MSNPAVMDKETQFAIAVQLEKAAKLIREQKVCVELVETGRESVGNFPWSNIGYMKLTIRVCHWVPR